MILQYFGHSFFSLTLESGKTICFDPYGRLYQYPDRKIPCDLCLISHHHDDHDGVSCVTGDPVVIDHPGSYAPFEGVVIHGVETDHDEKGGSLRGKNTVFIIEAEDLRIVHCGDLGHVLTGEQLQQIGKPDLLLMPVGGYYTIDAKTAEAVRAQLVPRVCVPMHYQTKYNQDMPIHPLAEYCELIGKKPEFIPFMRFTAQDICERDNVVFLSFPE